jgi:hypothetical protein
MSVINELENCYITISASASASENSLVSEKDSGKKFASEEESRRGFARGKSNPHLIYKKDSNKSNNLTKNKKIVKPVSQGVFINDEEYGLIKQKQYSELNSQEIVYKN